MNTNRSYEYINKYLYFVLRPDGGKGSFSYCSGVDLYGFLPITKGRHRPMSNPVMRGLQLVNLGVRALALDSGARPKTVHDSSCSGIVQPKDGWYKEALIIENAAASLPEEIIAYCVVDLMKKTFSAICLPEDGLPRTLPRPDELEALIDAMCVKYGGLT